MARLMLVGTVMVSMTLTAVAPTAQAAPSRAAATAPSASWPYSGHDLANSRNNSDERTLGVSNVASLGRKWSVAFTNNLTSTPAFSDGALYLPDRSGTMWSFDAVTGALRWSHTISSYTGITGDISRATPAVNAGRVVFGDQPGAGAHPGAYVIAVSTATGARLWNTVVDTQSTAKITGAPVIDGPTAYVGISSSDEVSPSCCHFRGSVIALDVATGRILWRTYTAPVGYTGAAVWGGSPVVDHTTGLLYVGTGNNYSVPNGVCTAPAQSGCTAPAANDYVDSLLALNLVSGGPTWALRTLSSDVSTNACATTTACGPDFDFGSAPNLFTATIAGAIRHLVGIGQKSGVYWVVDAATGALVWQTRVGPGGGGGGIQWGSAVDGNRIYVAIANSEHASYRLQPSGAVTTGGAFSALDPATGHILWQTADPQSAGDFGFVSSANGVVYAGSGAGSGTTMYALNGSTGAILWRYASGGSVMGGAAIVNATVYWASGYYTKTCPATQPNCGTTYQLDAFGLRQTTTPTSVTAAQTASSNATISWSAPANTGGAAVSGYRVARDGVDSNGYGQYSTTVAATARTFTMNILVSGRTYHLSVQAINAAGTGLPITAAVPIATTPILNAPSSFSITQSAAGSVTITWQPPTVTAGQTITGYKVGRDGVDSTGYGAYSTTAAATARSLTLNRLVTNATYTVTVQAVTATTTGPPTSGQRTMA